MNWGRIFTFYILVDCDLMLDLGRNGCGLKLEELGEAAGGIDYVSESAAVRRFGDRAKKDKAWARVLGQAIKDCSKCRM